MTEQEINEVALKTVDKVEHTREYNCCKHSYESLITTTKAFVFNFNNLSQEEKASFKSLQTYIKQLQKCMDTLKPQQTPRLVKKTDKTEKTDEVKETTTEVKTKRSVSKTSKQENKEESPTAVLVEETKNITEPVEDKKTKTATKKAAPVKKLA